ncbi:hypothetical protein [Trichormus variabilis]|uniref:Uncharacterized protein n=1 Tax=Trichormus variabilis SAG 1403-4b TaxID=447716 RepID=A0A3S1A9U4_ANAVA|nr:hypothetical protein [Trichormus variabilis]MBD2628021.1 hypothetical protein [Trichormus variabilis FACHB-164]RUS96742.1 hypothetical protein DSM107003_21480 [Trichormus variabilis SAG 1403-4b]
MNYDNYNSYDAEESLEQQAEKNRTDHRLKQWMNDEFEKRREWFEVKYQGYDAHNGLHRVQKVDGSVIYAQAKSIPGGIGQGDTLVAFCPSGSFPRLFMPL